MNNPYASQQKQALNRGSGPQAEGWALIEMARRLDAAKQSGDSSEILTQCRLNWRIWTILQSELVDPECTVPKEIRENLLSLSNFIDKRSTEVIGSPTADKLDVLININRQIGAGLMENNETSAEDTAAPTQQPSNPYAPGGTSGSSNTEI
ncbi:flagellar biosynthesis regulator FlaF [Curvivirga aplysinae]|uniref:flagellar biosynthesis regulator FlaF n=1 Tax=Curvivirga aplysinae TaxID=2529852 RepID=UPI0012BD7218|nr:flagellar biosynthesis regulator FlaF [Curvivirga aplysinae]